MWVPCTRCGPSANIVPPELCNYCSGFGTVRMKGWWDVAKSRLGSFLFSIGWRGIGLILLAGILFEVYSLTTWMVNSPSDALVFGGIVIDLVAIIVAFWVTSALITRRP